MGILDGLFLDSHFYGKIIATPGDTPDTLIKKCSSGVLGHLTDKSECVRGGMESVNDQRNRQDNFERGGRPFGTVGPRPQSP